jgi:hypothetical protein
MPIKAPHTHLPLSWGDIPQIHPISTLCNSLHDGCSRITTVMSSLFIDHNSETFTASNKVSLVRLPSLSPYYVLLDCTLPTEDKTESVRETESPPTPSDPLTAAGDADAGDVVGLLPSTPLKSIKKKGRRSVSDQSGNASISDAMKIPLAYNQYGELVNVEQLMRPPASTELNVTQTLRLIYKAYHREVRFILKKCVEFNVLLYI